MFIGHFAPALAAAAISTRAPKLGTLFVAAQLVDFAFFGLAIAGIEKMRMDPDATVMVPFDLYYMPYSHSLLGTAIWAVVFGLIVILWQRNAIAGLLSASVVGSHWLLDFLTHAPDLSLAGGEARYGLGLWNYPYIAIPLELGITLGAFYWYIKKTRGPDGPPIILLAVLLLLQAANWFAPAPAEATVGVFVISIASFTILALLAMWVGNNRQYIRRSGLESVRG